MAPTALMDEKPLTLAEAATCFPKRPNPATLWRWRKKGVRGVKLETVLIGGRRYVSRTALRQFIEAVTAAASGKPERASSRIGPRIKTSTTRRDVSATEAGRPHQLRSTENGFSAYVGG